MMRESFSGANVVSGSACKELRSHNSILTSEKLKNQQLLLYLGEKSGHRENCCHQTGERDKHTELQSREVEA